jgi:hypothetical protein
MLPLTVRLDPTVRVVVVVREPGTVIATGREMVIVPGLPAVVISEAVPAIVMLLATGDIAPPEPPVRVFKEPAMDAMLVHVEDVTPAEVDFDVSM